MGDNHGMRACRRRALIGSGWDPFSPVGAWMHPGALQKFSERV